MKTRSAREVARRWASKVSLVPERLALLEALWETKFSRLSRLWELRAVKGATLYVRPRSPAAAQELKLREREILEGLNAHFTGNWLRVVRAVRHGEEIQ